MTYARLWRQVEDTRSELLRLGVGSGSVIATLLPSGPMAAVSFLALASTAVVAPLNPVLTERELLRAFGCLKPELVVLSEQGARHALSAAQALELPVLRLQESADGPAGEFAVSTAGWPGAATLEDRWPAAEDPALLLSTSGTSGPPKAVVLTHHNVVAAAAATCVTHGLGPVDVRLNVMPMFHVQGLVGAVGAAVVSGGSVVCTPGFDPARFAAWVDEHEATWFSGSPTMYREILKSLSGSTRLNTTTIRFLRVGSAALPLSLREQIEDRFEVPVIESYGMTEAHQIASTALSPALQRKGTVGQPTGCDVLIVGEDDESVARGEPGEILIRGPNVGSHASTGKGPLAPAEWFHTGDVGMLDRDGYLTILGRRKEMINRGGEKISPYEVEEALSAHPAIREVAAFGLPHPDYGEDVAAAVVTGRSDSVDARELRLFLSDRLAAFKLPGRFFFLDAIPRGATGKIERRRLADQFGGTMNQDKDKHQSDTMTATESALLSVWKSVLEVDDISIEDDFFVVGGDSLKGMKLLSEVTSVFGVEIPPLSMYDETSTAASMASFIDHQRNAAA